MKNALILLLLCVGLSGCTTLDCAKRREYYIHKHMDMSEKMKSDIRSGFLREGMSKSEVKASLCMYESDAKWRESRSCTSWGGCTEIWRRGNDYLIFDNEKLKSFTNMGY